MKARVTDALPDTKKGLQDVVDGFSWITSLQKAQDDQVASSRFREKVSYGFAAICICALGFQASQPPPQPVPIVVDKMTGATTVHASFGPESVPALSSSDEHWAAVFVRSCESYYFNLLKRDFDQCARMSTPELFRSYAAKFSGDNAMQTKIGATQEHEVKIIGTRASSTTKPGRRGEIIVTFDKEVRSTQGLAPVTTRYVATLGFEYRPGAMKKKVDQIENPFGYVGIAYRADAELVSPNAPIARAPS